MKPNMKLHHLPFAITIFLLSHAPTPIRRNNFTFNVFMERRMRPICYALHPAVLDGIVMDVIHVPRKVVIIPDLVFPIAPLP
jgi:hypothetical protein